MQLMDTKKNPVFVKRKSVRQKKTAMLKAMNLSALEDESVDTEILHMEGAATDAYIDESGKTIRWSRMIEENQAP